MSQPERKWREFWISGWDHIAYPLHSPFDSHGVVMSRTITVFVTGHKPDNHNEAFCVIERAAYDELERQLAFYKDGVHEENIKQKFKIEELKAEVERLKEYEEHVWKYVQGTDNTSPKTIGFHVAEALVMDHKDLKQKLQQAEAEIEFHKTYAIQQNKAAQSAIEELTKERKISAMLREALEKISYCPVSANGLPKIASSALASEKEMRK